MSYYRLISIMPKSSVDPDAQAFITAAGITNPTQQQAINTLVVDLKGYGIWSKMRAIYPFVGGTASTHKWNLKDPRDLDAAFRLVFNGGWTHSANGAQPNGTNGWANTFFMPSLIQNVNSNGLGMYITQNTTSVADPVQMGSFVNTLSASLVLATSIRMNSKVNGATANVTTITGGAGSFDAHRTSATITKQYKNAALIDTWNSGGTLPAQFIYLGTMNINGNFYTSGWTNSQFRFAYMSEGLNDTEVSNLRTLVQAYQTTLGRQV